MINSRVQIALIAGVLIALGVGLTLYKAVSLDLPLVPGEYREVWTVESKASFTPGKGQVNVELSLPVSLAGWVIIDEHFVSSGFGFSIVRDSDNTARRVGRVSRWSVPPRFITRRKSIALMPTANYRIWRLSRRSNPCWRRINRRR